MAILAVFWVTAAAVLVQSECSAAPEQRGGRQVSLMPTEILIRCVKSWSENVVGNRGHIRVMC